MGWSPGFLALRMVSGTAALTIAGVPARLRRKVAGVGRQDRTGQDRTGQDRTGQDRTGHDDGEGVRSGRYCVRSTVTYPRVGAAVTRELVNVEVSG